MKPRSEGKIKGTINTKQIYKEYVSHQKKNKKVYVSCSDFSDICKTFNLQLRNKAINECEIIKLPYRLGYYRVIKCDINYSKLDKKKWAIDWKKSKELGQKIYFVNDFRYQIIWDKKECRLKNKNAFKFISCRHANRQLANEIKNGKDYINQPY